MKTTALIVVAGIAAAASGQGVMTFSWTYSDTGNGDGLIEDGETGIATLWAEMVPDATGFAGSIFDVDGDARYADGSHTFDNFLDALSDDGTDNGNGYFTKIEAFQLPPAFNPDFDASNPIAVGELTYTPNSYAIGVANFSTENHLNSDVYTDTFGTSETYDLVITPGVFSIVPAPASMALLGLGGLIAGRRRR